MAEIEPQDSAQGDRRAFIRKGLIAGGAAVALPVVSTFNVPAGAQLGSNPVTSSLSLTVPADDADATKDSQSAALSGGVGCVLAGYTSGQSTAFTASGPTSQANGVTAETATITVGSLPSSGACSVSGIARCGASGTCTPATASKADGATSVVLNFSAPCGGNTGFEKIYITVTC